MKITKRQLRRIIFERCSLDNTANYTGDSSIPVPEDYNAVTNFLDQNSQLADMSLDFIMNNAGANCKKSSVQAIIDFLQNKISNPELYQWNNDGLPGDEVVDLKQESREKSMRISKTQLKRIIKEEKARILREQESTQAQADHHWPRVDWKGVEELTDKWIDMEEKSWDKGDTSMNPDSKSDRDAQTYWNDQVESCAMDMEAEMVLRIRRIALQTMKEYSQKLIEGEYA